MIKTIIPAFLLAAALILSAASIAPRQNMVGHDGCDLSYGVEGCERQVSSVKSRIAHR